MLQEKSMRIPLAGQLLAVVLTPGRQLGRGETIMLPPGSSGSALILMKGGSGARGNVKFQGRRRCRMQTHQMTLSASG